LVVNPFVRCSPISLWCLFVQKKPVDMLEMRRGNQTREYTKISGIG
jgi:hypothetical protein